MPSMRIAERVRRIKPSASTSAADRANQLRRDGRSIINLAVGEPDFDTPLHVRLAAGRAMEAGETRYGAMTGSPVLREAISDKLHRDNGLAYGPDEIIVTAGAKSAIYGLLATTLGADDEVIIPAPFWVSYPDMVLACDGVPVTVVCPEAQGFKLTPADLEAAITPRTRWLILNSPANPTGATYSAEEYRALAEVLLRHPNILVMTDDIYEHIRFDGGIAPHLLTAAPRLRCRTLAVNGVSKTYAMTGWRIGWIAGPREILTPLLTFLSQSAGNPCSVSQAAAAEALAGDQAFVAQSVATYRERRDAMAVGINAIPGLSCRVPEGAFYLFVNCGGLIGRRAPDGSRLTTDADVVMSLLDAVGVAVVAGAAYGLSPYFRLSIAASLDTLQEGVARIARAVGDLAEA